MCVVHVVNEPTTEIPCEGIRSAVMVSSDKLLSGPTHPACLPTACLRFVGDDYGDDLLLLEQVFEFCDFERGLIRIDLGSTII